MADEELERLIVITPAEIGVARAGICRWIEAAKDEGDLTEEGATTLLFLVNGMFDGLSEGGPTEL